MPTIRGRGSIIPLDKTVSKSKCKRWQIRFNIGRDLATGKYKQVARNIVGTYSDAERALRKLIIECEDEGTIRKSNMLFGDYASAWLQERKETKAHGTWRSEVDRIKCVNIHLAKAKLHEITPDILESVYQKLLDGKSPSGKKLSKAYVKSIDATLHRLFKQAVKDKHIQSNPCDLTETPASDTKEKKSLSLSQMKELLSKLDATQPSQLTIILALRTGMRRGEIHGLSWCDIDFEKHEISIKHSYDTGGHLKVPKTKNSCREIPVSKNTIDCLEKRRYALREQLSNNGLKLTADTPVICNELGERMLPSSTTRWWVRNRDSFGLSGFTVHEMRHSYLSEMARNGTDVKVLQMLAGHANFSTTMDIYTHVKMEQKRAAIDAINW